MARSGIATGPYHFPDWEDSATGLPHLLDNLFRLTPPSALIINEPFVFHAVKDHLARQGILAPDRVSLVCSDPDPSFLWLRPAVSRVRWDSRPGPWCDAPLNGPKKSAGEAKTRPKP